MLTENNNHLVAVLFKPFSFLKLAVHFFEMSLLLVASGALYLFSVVTVPTSNLL